MNEDLRGDLDVASSLLEELSDLPVDPSRMLVVVSAGGRDADLLLPATLARLTSQRGPKLDIIVGGNNGTRLPRTLERGESLGLVVGEARCEPPKSICEPARVLDARGAPLSLGPTSGHRLIVVHQPPKTPENKGKARMLRDLYGWIVSQWRAGWTPPEFLFACDAESWLTDRAGQRGLWSTTVLEKLVGALLRDSTISLVGTTNHFSLYDHDESGDLVPRVARAIPPIHTFLNLVHGRLRGYRWLPGGGTLGKTSVLSAIMTTILTRWNNPAIEDVQATVLARSLDLRYEVYPGVWSMNRCSTRNTKEARDQIKRWNNAALGLRERYGEDAIREVARSPSATSSFLHGILGFLIEAATRPSWRLVPMVPRLFLALGDYGELLKDAQPTDMDDENASW